MCSLPRNERSFTVRRLLHSPLTTPLSSHFLSLSLSLSSSSTSSMEKPRFNPKTQTHTTHQTLSPSSSGRRSYDSKSPEFEFWMVRNPSFPQPHLLSADELIVDGVLLPLHLLPNHSEPPDSDHPTPKPETPNPKPELEPGPGPESSTVLSTSKRWRDIFKMGDKKTTRTATNNQEDKQKDKEKKKERKSSSGVSAAAELNINIWPFSRSHSAGNNGNRPKMAAGAATRKVSSAPCSRSNSSGESKSKKWPSSPGRGGVHLGRSSPVWQVRRGGSCVRSSEHVVRQPEKGVRKEGLEKRRSKSTGSGGGDGARVRVLNLNVPMCIGYRHHLSCRSDENSTVGGGSGGGGQSSGGGAGNGGSGGNLFNLRTLFSKKVY